MFEVIASALNTSITQSAHKTLTAAIREAKKHTNSVWIKNTETGQDYDRNGNPRS